MEYHIYVLQCFDLKTVTINLVSSFRYLQCILEVLKNFNNEFLFKKECKTLIFRRLCVIALVISGSQRPYCLFFIYSYVL